jgi:glucose/mannose transport system substrate-binding protein
VHRVNWLWYNPDVFKKAKAKVPTTWDELFEAAEKIKKAGYLPIAHGGQAWQDATVFEAIVLAVGGADFYNKVFVDLDNKSLGSSTMRKSFEVFRKYQSYVDANAAGRDWNLATAMVIEGKAAMQIMGDWAKGEFTAAGKKPGKGFGCVAVPGTAKDYTFNIDSFILFNQSNKNSQKAQNAFARLIMEPEFQEVFNLNKGSIPVRPKVPLGKFDSCAKLSVKDFANTAKRGTLVPSMAHGMSTFPGPQGQIYDTVTNFFNSNQSASAAAKALASSVKSAQ